MTRALLIVCLASSALAQPKPAPPLPTPGRPKPTRTEQIVAATQSFLGSLTPPELAKAQRPFRRQNVGTAVEGHRPFVGERYGDGVWSNFPTSDVARPGIKLGSLNAAQRADALAVWSVVLSPTGYQKILDIMDSDQALAASGTPYDAGGDFYFLAIFGTPSATKPWMLELGGHHLGLNVVVEGSHVSITPTLTGDQPATFVRDGKTVRPLGRENDKAFELMNALDAGQQKQATLAYDIHDLVLGPGQDGRTLPPEGLCAKAMTKKQQAMLLDLIGEWVGLLNEEQAAPKLRDVRANLDQTYFAWHGATKNPSPIYFRITGPTLHIELAHQQVGQGGGVQAGGVNHVHAIYRDPTNEYGAAALR